MNVEIWANILAWRKSVKSYQHKSSYWCKSHHICDSSPIGVTGVHISADLAMIKYGTIIPWHE